MKSHRQLSLFSALILISAAAFAAPGPAPDKIYLDGKPVYGETGMKAITMIPVKGGSFTMGDAKASGLEKPQRQVTVSDFAMSETELTYGQLFGKLGLSEKGLERFIYLASSTAEQIAATPPALIQVAGYADDVLLFRTANKVEAGTLYNARRNLDAKSYQVVAAAEVRASNPVMISGKQYYENLAAVVKSYDRNLDLAPLVKSGALSVYEKTAEEHLADEINESDDGNGFRYLAGYVFFKGDLVKASTYTDGRKPIAETELRSLLNVMRPRYRQLLATLKSAGAVPADTSLAALVRAFDLSRFPVTATWTQAVVLCNFLSGREGLEAVYSIEKDEKGNVTKVSADFARNGYRLPTEAEWEYAARGGPNQDAFLYAGSNDPAQVATFNEVSLLFPNPVKLRKPNSLGLHDMSGNVAEWAWDYFDAYSANPASDPRGPAEPTKKNGANRAIRGGGWVSSAAFVTVARRTMTKYIVNSGIGHIGVRLARTGQ